tara:strand:- start:7 stop:243 length:237 start_codon:yes stop_codon:yes gene_type:complete
LIQLELELVELELELQHFKGRGTQGPRGLVFVKPPKAGCGAPDRKTDLTGSVFFMYTFYNILYADSKAKLSIYLFNIT